jgi:hypothetical protein
VRQKKEEVVAVGVCMQMRIRDRRLRTEFCLAFVISVMLMCAM